MKAKQNLIVLYSIILGMVYSCEKQQLDQNRKAVNNYKNENVMEKEILQKQLSYGNLHFFQDAGVEMPKPDFSIEELRAIGPTAHNILDDNTYIKLTDEQFKTKIKLYFDRTLEMHSENNLIYINFLNKCNKKMILHANNNLEYEGIYIFKNEKLITDFYYLP